MEINDYLNLAIEKQGFNSDRELQRALDLKTNTSISFMRHGKGFPSDHTMMKLAELADEPVDVALLRLNLWRSKTPETRKHYAAITDRLAKQASIWLICIAIITLSAVNPVTNNAYAAQNIARTDLVSITPAINCATF